MCFVSEQPPRCISLFYTRHYYPQLYASIVPIVLHNTARASLASSSFFFFYFPLTSRSLLSGNPLLFWTISTAVLDILLSLCIPRRWFYRVRAHVHQLPVMCCIFYFISSSTFFSFFFLGIYRGIRRARNMRH